MIGNDIKKHRKSQNLTQKQLADRATVSTPTIGLLESGESTLHTLNSVLNALQCEFFSNQLEPIGTIGNRIKTLRKKKKISQKIAGEIIGVTPATISTIENHSRGRISTLEALARVCGCVLQVQPTYRKKAFYAETALTSFNEVWTTPPHIIESLILTFGGFDLDQCAESSDTKTINSKAKIAYTKKDNGLKKPWFGTVFANPPYGRSVGEWVKKCYTEAKEGNAHTIIALLASRTDTRWFHQYIAGVADVFFIKGRLKFGDGKTPAPFPSILAVWTVHEYDKEKLKILIKA